MHFINTSLLTRHCYIADALPCVQFLDIFEFAQWSNCRTAVSTSCLAIVPVLFVSFSVIFYYSFRKSLYFQVTKLFSCFVSVNKILWDWLKHLCVKRQLSKPPTNHQIIFTHQFSLPLCSFLQCYCVTLQVCDFASRL